MNLSDSNPTHSGLAPDILPEVYTADPRGSAADRQAIAEFVANTQGRVVSPEHLYVLSSTSEAYSWLFKVLCNPGDTVLAPAPGYPLVESIAQLENVYVEYYPLDLHDSWRIDTGWLAERLDAQASSGTGDTSSAIKAIVAINPNNPTGSYVHQEERAKLIDLCVRHDIALIADEVFYSYPLDPLPGVTRLAGEDRVLTFALDGLSKQLAAPGAKVAWIEASGPEGVLDEALRRLDVVADAFLPMSQLISRQLPSLLAQVDAQHAVVARRLRHNMQLCRGLIRQDPAGLVSCGQVEAAWSVLLRFPSTVDEQALVLRLIRDAGITMQPGYFFDMPLPGFVAASLLVDPADFEHGLRVLVDQVSSLQQ